LLVALGPTAARADEEGALAERLRRAGERASMAGRHEDATLALERALELRPVPAIRLAAAQAYERWYATTDLPAYVRRAVELFRRYIREQGRGGRIADAAAALDELEPELERHADRGPVPTLPPRPARTVLMLSSPHDGAQGRIDELAGPLPLVAEVAPGPHTVTVEAEGYASHTQQTVAADDELTFVELELEPLPGRLLLETEAGAVLRVDGRARGTAPLATPVELPPGRHHLSVSRRGRKVWRKSITVERGVPLTLQAALKPTGQRRAVPWVLGGAGALMFGAGCSALWALYQGDLAEELDERRQAGPLTPSELEAYHDHRDRHGAAITTTWALVGASVVTVGVAALLYVLDAPPRDDRSFDEDVVVQPMVGDDGGGVMLLGRF